MAETTNYQCPNCNGRLFYSGESGKLQCEFCESQFTPAEIEALYAEKQAKADDKVAGDRQREAAAELGIDTSSMSSAQQSSAIAAFDNAIRSGATQEQAQAAAWQAAQNAAKDAGVEAVSAAAASTTDATRVQVKHSQAEDPVQAYLENSRWDDADADNMRAFNCSSCGAQLMVDQVTAVTSCPYCGNNTVVPGQLSDVLKPDYIIPFKLDKNAAIAALKQYYGGKKFLPNGFTEGNNLEEVEGVYVPFWLYTGQAEGDFTFDATNSRTWTDTENMYTETDHYKLYRVGTMEFDMVPTDGSTKMPDAHMDAIEPFDYSEMVPFSVAYLPGYLTDRYDLDVAQCDARARTRVEATCADAMTETAQGYETASLDASHVEVSWSNVAYALLPVWMLHTRWNDEDYLFAMNGQTGKFIGDLPIDPGKVRMRFLVLFLPILIVIVLIVIFVFGGFSL